MINEFDKNYILNDRIQLMLEQLDDSNLREDTIDMLCLEEGFSEDDVIKTITDNIDSIYEDEWINFCELWNENITDFYNTNTKDDRLIVIITDENCNDKEYTFNNPKDFELFCGELLFKADYVDYGFYTIYPHGIYLNLKNREQNIEINIKSLEEK